MLILRYFQKFTIILEPLRGRKIEHEMNVNTYALDNLLHWCKLIRKHIIPSEVFDQDDLDSPVNTIINMFWDPFYLIN